MKAIFEQISYTTNNSIKSLHVKEKIFDFPWHFHPEIELSLIVKGKGKRFVGNNIATFSENDLVITGSNLPHMWSSENKLDTANSEAIVIQFPEEIFLNLSENMPEFMPVVKLLNQSALGLSFDKLLAQKLYKKIIKVVKSQHIERFCHLAILLSELSKEKKTIITDRIYQNSIQHEKDQRLQKVYNFISENYTQQLKIEEAAAKANMNTTAFCRFFKKQTLKTFSQFVNELRIGYAKKLLIQQNLSITSICYTCGFENISYFNRVFKKITHQTPGQYQQNFRNYAEPFD